MMKLLKIFCTAAIVCLVAQAAPGGLFGLGGGLAPVGASKKEWVASTNLAQARNISSTNVEVRLVAFTNLAVTVAMTNGWDVKPLEEGANINLSFGDGGDVVVSVTGVLLPIQTNGWDVSAGGGGGGNADDTNYWGVLRYGSNDWQSLTTGVTNDCIFSLEAVDFGNLCNPLTGHITTRKTGWWEVHASWWLVHPIAAAKLGVFMVMTSDVQWISHAIGANSEARMETHVWRVQDRAYLPSGTVVRCTFYHNSGLARLGGGDIDHASGYPHNTSVFMMDFIQE